MGQGGVFQIPLRQTSASAFICQKRSVPGCRVPIPVRNCDQCETALSSSSRFFIIQRVLLTSFRLELLFVDIDQVLCAAKSSEHPVPSALFAFPCFYQLTADNVKPNDPSNCSAYPPDNPL